jgi:hypothetical protein
VSTIEDVKHCLQIEYRPANDLSDRREPARAHLRACDSPQGSCESLCPPRSSYVNDYLLNDMTYGSLQGRNKVSVAVLGQAAFFGPTVANGALRTWLDLQLAPPRRD